MFGLNDDEDQTNTAPFEPNDNSSSDLVGPAPGAPVGPITGDFSAPPTEPATTPDSAKSKTHNQNNPDNDGLLNIKQEALQALSPLVNHLDQPPEEKFRTTMMMIQASDDQSLVRSAYDTAKNISDEKARAQALLDVINEINYFTQRHHD
jgi:hypothetical protein